MTDRRSTLIPRLRACYHVARSRLRRIDTIPPRPHAAHVIITWDCNLQCGGCSAWQRDETAELGSAEWARIFPQLKGLDIVKIIGGEPFTRGDLPDIVRTIRREVNPYVLQLVTNGTMTEKIVSFVKAEAWPSLHLRLSLDGLGETHDEARGVGGTFDQVMETMKRLAEVRKLRPFQMAVNFTVTDRSLGDMKPLVELCRTMNIDVVTGFKVKPFLRSCDVTREKVETIGIADGEAALERLETTPHGARSGFSALERLFLKSINRLILRKHMKGEGALKFRCRELRNLIYLNPYGEIITCGLNQEPVGNILEEGFEGAWFSPEADSARSHVDCCPGCMQGAVEVMSRLYA